MPLRAVIVDDEPPARNLLQEYVAEFPEITVVATCGSGREAVEVVNAQAPDLLFLDVQMPGLDGFEVLAHLDYLPHLIFTTAYDAFALRAFEAGALDYLLKPFTRGRFRKAIERALQRDREREAAQVQTMLHAARPGPLSRLFVRVGERIVPVETAQILWIRAAGDYTELITESETHLCTLGIGALEPQLDPARFARVHRSSILALPAIRTLHTDGEGGYWADLTNGDRVRISRSYAPVIRDLVL